MNSIIEKKIHHLFSVKKGDVKYWSLIPFIYIIYSILFWASNSSAKDRSNYFKFFEDPDASRFEPGFVLIGKAFQTLQLPPELSLFIVASVMFWLAAVTLRMHFPSKPYTANLLFVIIFFGICVLYSFIQIRSGFALWVSLFLFSLFLKSNRTRYIWLMFVAVLFHYSVIFFVLIVFAYFVLNFGKKTLFTLSTIGFLLLSLGMEYFINVLGMGSYYMQYLTTDDANVRTSITVLSLISLLILWPFYKKYFDHQKYFTALLVIPVITFAFIFIFEIFIKMIFPLIVLLWIGALKAILTDIREKEIKDFVYVGLMMIVPVTFLYAVLRAGII